MKRIRVLVVDDSALMRMDGLEALKLIMEDFGTPTIIVSSLTKRDAELTFQSLENGAFDFVTKPQSEISAQIREIGNELIEKVKAAYENPLARLKIKPIKTAAAKKEESPFLDKKTADRVLAIGISTGGPNALSYLLPQIPEDFPAAVLVAQHMPPGFTEMFAIRLDTLCKIEVKEAKDGDLVLPGRALIAPGDKHLKIHRRSLGTVAVLSDSAPVNGHKPSADVLFESVAHEYGSNATGLIMTGMDSDGAEGIGGIMARGGLTVAQDENSCVVFGMPKAAIKRKHIQRVVSLDDMGDFLINYFVGKEIEYGTSHR
jgi:two-component system chemotaxis response regulator CheB